jgi:hypothetical protein
MSAKNPNSAEAKESFAKSKAKLEAESKASKETLDKAKAKLEDDSKKIPASQISAFTALSDAEFTAAKTEIKRVAALQQVAGNNTLLNFAQKVQSEVMAKIKSSSF